MSSLSEPIILSVLSVNILFIERCTHAWVYGCMGDWASVKQTLPICVNPSPEMMKWTDDSNGTRSA